MLTEKPELRKIQNLPENQSYQELEDHLKNERNQTTKKLKAN